MIGVSEEGARLGRYTLVRRIGVGGMGEVWLAKVSGAHGFEKLVALKRILPQFSANPHVVNMLVDEARISVLLNHPNVVQVLELGEEDDELFIAMEFVDGVSLSRMLRRLSKLDTRLDALEACFIAIQILEGLHAAHVQKDHRGKPAGIIHRDVSPQNILLSMDGQVKVIDFGIARARARLEVTRGVHVKGKLRYMAPEQIAPKLIQGEPIDHRVDVFAAGILLFEMLAHRQRFPGDVEAEIVEAILKEDTPDLARERLIERELMDILDTALEKDRRHRYADAAAFASALRGYLFKRDPAFNAERIARRLRETFGDIGGEGADEPRSGLARRPKDPLSDEDDHDLEGGEAPDPEVTRTVFRPRGPARRGAARGPQDTHGAAHGAADGDAGRDQDEARKPGRAVARHGLRAGGAGSPGAPGERARRVPQRSARPLGPAIAAGILVGAALLGLGRVVLRPRTVGPSASEQPTPPSSLLEPPPITARLPSALEAADGALTVLVRAAPATTRISLADRPDPKFVSPAHIKLPLQEVVELVFEAEGYETVRRKVRVVPGMPPVDVTLAPLPVDLVIHVAPRDAVVTVNGTPAKPGMKVLPGERIEVRAEHPFGLPRVVEAVPRPGEPLVVELKLEEVEKAAPGGRVARGTIVITSRPPGADVFIDGTRLRGTTPVETQVLAGSHRITVRATQGEQTFSVQVADGDTFKREVVLE